MLHKSRIYPLILIIAVFIVWKIRDSKKSEWISFEGQTMGTTYSIKYESKSGTNLQPQIDSILANFNLSLSTYIYNSEISRFNRDTVLYPDLPYFIPVMERSALINKETNGAFDPTIMPLVNAWGFGPDNTSLPDSASVDSLMQFIGFDKVGFDEKRIWKTKQGVQLDFSAIAKGYGVDVVGNYLKEKDHQNYFVEIGGEVVVSGINDKGTLWRLGVEDPTKELFERTPKAIVELDNKGMATSGNYRNYYVKEGRKFAHTIDPSTGFPIEHSLLSATVFAPDCMTADAYATAFMVMGLDKAKEILENIEALEAFLIYSDNEGQLRTYSSEGTEKITLIE
jgi:thiamine biosynthesis lipoprotein